LLLKNSLFLSSIKDVQLRTLLLLGSCLLPLGERYSIDNFLQYRRREERRRKRNEEGKEDEGEGEPSSSSASTYQHISFSSLGFQVFFLSSYWFSSSRDPSLLHFSLLLHSEYHRTFFGRLLLSFSPLWFPSLLNSLFFFWQRIGSLLVFSPFFTSQLRLLSVSHFTLFHLLSSLCVQSGTPLVYIFPLLSFLPSEFWTRLHFAAKSRYISFSSSSPSVSSQVELRFNPSSSLQLFFAEFISYFFLPLPRFKLTPLNDSLLSSSPASSASSSSFDSAWTFLDVKGKRFRGSVSLYPLLQSSALFCFFPQLPFDLGLLKNLTEWFFRSVEQLFFLHLCFFLLFLFVRKELTFSSFSSSHFLYPTFLFLPFTYCSFLQLVSGLVTQLTNIAKKPSSSDPFFVLIEQTAKEDMDR
jgi:hypothetical protein